MSKILKIMIVLLTILAVAAPVVIAEDRLSLSGSMRVRGFSLSEYDFNDAQDETDGFFDQRLRIAGKISIAEGVSITFRTDITEQTWGNNGGLVTSNGSITSDSGRFGAGRGGSTQQWDRAHIDLTSGMVHFRGGQQFALLGTGIAFDNQGTGLRLNLKTGAPITLLYFRQDDLGETTSDDADLYGAQIGHKTDNYAANIFAGYAHKDPSLDDFSDAAIFLVGASGTFNAGPVFIKAELDYFGGDFNDGAGVDAEGLQGYIDVSAPITESFTLGGMFIYAEGQDLVSDGVQITRLGNGFNGWAPESFGPFTTDFDVFQGNYIFDFTGNGAGVISLSAYSTFKAGDDTDLTANLMYLEPEDDGLNGNDVDDAITFNAGVDYKLMDNTNLAAQFNYTALSVKTGSDPDDAYGFMGRVQVVF